MLKVSHTEDFSESQCLLFLFHAVESLAQAEELCRRVYFPIQPPSIGALTLFNGMFKVILSDLISHPHDEVADEDVKHFHDLCRANFQAGIETYELVTTPSYEHTLALSIAVRWARYKVYSTTTNADAETGRR